MTTKTQPCPKIPYGRDTVSLRTLQPCTRNSTATIVGVVTDPQGLAVANAKADIRNVATNEVRQVESDARGEFTVPNLTPGLYNVSIGKEGFTLLETKGVELQLSQQARMEFHLKMGSVGKDRDHRFRPAGQHWGAR